MKYPLFSAKKPGAHFAKHTNRKRVNAVLYIEKTGCQWRQPPHDFPNWSTVKPFCCRAKESGLWERMRVLPVEKSCVELTGKKRKGASGIS